VRQAIRLRYIVLLVFVVLSAFGLRYTAANLGINTDTANMIAGDLPWRDSFDEYRSLFSVRDRNLVVLVEAEQANIAEQHARELAAKMRAEPALFPSVFLAGDGEFFARNGLLYLSVDELEALSDRLVAAQPLIGQIALRPNGAGVLGVLADAIEESRQFAGEDPVEPLQRSIANLLETSRTGAAGQLDWRALLETGEQPSSRQLILIRPDMDFSRVRPAREAIERIRSFIEEIEPSAQAPVVVRMTGTVALEHEELDSVVSSASLAGALALVMVIIVLYWALRSVRLLFISVFVLLVGLIGTAALAAVTVGHLNLFSVAFAVLYVGLGVDFLLHVSLRVKEALADGQDIDTAIVGAMQSIGASLVICTLTTAAAFYAFVPSRLFEGISELGMIAGNGMFVSFIVSVTLLPAMLSIFYRSRHRSSDVRMAMQLTSFATQRARTVVAVSAVLVVLAAVSLPSVYFDSNPVNLRDPNSESVVALSDLARDSDADMLTMVALFDSEAQIAEVTQLISALEQVRTVRGVTSLVPDDQGEKLFLLEDLVFVMGPGFADVDYVPAAESTLLDAARRLQAVLESAGDDSASRARLASEVEQFVARASDGSGAGEVQQLDRALLGNLPDQLGRLEQSLLAEEFAVTDLPPELLERWIAADGTMLIEIVPQENIRDNDAAARFVGAVRGAWPEATGLPVVYDEAANVIVTSFRQALIYAVIAIAVILLIFLRSVRDSMIVLIPILCAAILTAGSTAWIGIPFNFANIIALPLLMGVGVDNAIHMLHRLRAGKAPGESGSTSLAVFASGLTTIASFGNLAFSSHLGMATMGTLLTIGMFVMMAATLIFLPALLRLGVR
jgi:hopanoid biosynthesis associated RND transporter like protein HpnN